MKNIGEYTFARDMLADVKKAYGSAAAAIHADGIIPCGPAMLKATELGIQKIHRDQFHASFGAGRYLLALTWYKTLTGKDISQNSFDELDEPITEEERQILINAVNSVV